MKNQCLSESRKLSGFQRHSTKSLNTPDSSLEKHGEFLRKTECDYLEGISLFDNLILLFIKKRSKETKNATVKNFVGR